MALPTFSPFGFSPSRAALVLVPVIIPAAYSIYITWTIRKSCTLSTGRLSGSPAAANDDTVPRLPESLPEEVVKSPSEWIVTFEREIGRASCRERV